MMKTEINYQSDIRSSKSALMEGVDREYGKHTFVTNYQQVITMTCEGDQVWKTHDGLFRKIQYKQDILSDAE